MRSRVARLEPDCFPLGGDANAPDRGLGPAPGGPDDSYPGARPAPKIESTAEQAPPETLTEAGS